MNCDEATLVLAWTPLGNGVHEAPISYLLPACYWCWVSVCVRLSVCRKKYGHYPRTLFTWVRALQGTDLNEPVVSRCAHVNGFVAICIGLPPFPVYIPLWIYVKWRLYTLQRSILSWGGGSIWSEISSSCVFSFNTINTRYDTINTSYYVRTICMHLKCTPARTIVLTVTPVSMPPLLLYYDYTRSYSRCPYYNITSAVLRRVPPLPLTVLHLRLLPLLVPCPILGCWWKILIHGQWWTMLDNRCYLWYNTQEDR